MRTGVIYKAELEHVELKSFCRFVERHWPYWEPRLVIKRSAGSDDYGVCWYLWSHGNQAAWLSVIFPDRELKVEHDEIALGWLLAQQLRTDRLTVKLQLDDLDYTIPPGESDDPMPWHERRLTDWILEITGGWVKHHYGVDLVAQIDNDDDDDTTLTADQTVTVVSTVSEPESPRTLKLTPRQVQIAKLIVSGLTQYEISEELVISEKTVNKHSENIGRALAIAESIDGGISVAKKIELLRRYGFGETVR